MKPVLLVILLFATNFSFAQVKFHKVYKNPQFHESRAIIERFDGNYLMAGSIFNPLTADREVKISLVDTLGKLLWDKSLGSSMKDEWAISIIETKDSNYVISGQSDPKPCLIKFDISGNMIWQQVYYSYEGNAYSVGQTIDGGYYFVLPNEGFMNSWLIVTDSLGNQTMARFLHYAQINCVIQTTDGGFAMAGKTNRDVTGEDIILIKTNSLGDTLWTKTYDGPGYDDAKSLVLLPDGGFIIAGEYDTDIPDATSDPYLIRTDSLGDTLWTKRLWAGSSHYIKKCKGNDGFILSTDRYVIDIIYGEDKAYSLIYKFDSLGNYQWEREFEADTRTGGNNITQTSDGGFLLTYSHGLYSSSSNSNIHLVKFDALGNTISSINKNQGLNPSHLSAFPNPAKGEINFRLDSNTGLKIRQVKIFNFIGQELKIVDSMNAILVKIEINNFAPGLYFYELKSSDNQMVSGRFIVGE